MEVQCKKNNVGMRIPYIDALKGLAILCVVMGHQLSCIYPNFLDAQSVNAAGTILQRVIYSFHMPLFMFCSGFVFHKPKDFFSRRNVANLIKKKFVGLMIPYFAMGFVSYIFIERFFVYWYLYSLFVFYFITVIIEWFMSRFRLWKTSVSTLFFLTISFLFFLFREKIEIYEELPFLDFGHFSLYFWFILGMVSRRHKWHEILQSRSFIFQDVL